MIDLNTPTAKVATALELLSGSMPAVVLLFAFATTTAHAQTLATLVNFDLTNGANSTATLVQGPDGELYGTTYSGGAASKGTIFRMSPAGALTSLHSFTGPDGQNPIGGLVLARQGGLLGTTFVGGAYGQNTNGYGTVVRMTVSESFSLVQSFDGTEGQNPEGALTLGNDGNYYGTARFGGANGAGAVVKITPAGAITDLHNFVGPTDGSEPIAGLTLGRDGNFYGVTYTGGAGFGGTIFKVTPGGTFTLLHNFTDSSDGSGSVSTLLLGTDGNFYGTTGSGGAKGAGTAFRITPAGVFRVLHSFDGSDGTGPGALVLGTDGNFYGVTSSGGSSNFGTVFRMNPAGGVAVLHNFSGSDGENPYAGLVQHTNGKLYGVTYSGGSNGDGTIFSMDLGLPPFVSLQFPSAKVGGTIGILGQGFTGATGVSINAATASFKVISDTYLVAVVPAEAVAGYVEVDTPTEHLISNRRLQVR